MHWGAGSPAGAPRGRGPAVGERRDPADQAAGRTGADTATGATPNSASIRHTWSRVQSGQIQLIRPSGSCWLLQARPAASAGVRGRAQAGQEWVSMAVERLEPRLPGGEPGAKPALRRPPTT